MEKHKMAACGIDCNVCGQYKVTMYQDLQAAEQLVPWFRSRGWIGENEGAAAVMQRAPLCHGCWSTTGVVFCSDNCLRDCCVTKNHEHCGQCNDFPCEKYLAWVGGLEHHQKALELLQTLKA